MREIDKLEQKITSDLSKKTIKSVNDFCIKYFTSVLQRPIPENGKEITNIYIYSDRDEAHDIAKTFKFLIKAYIDLNYIELKDEKSLPILKPYWDYDTRYCVKNMTIFPALHDSCDLYSQKIFIINKPIRLKLLSLFRILPELNDFKTAISYIFMPLKVIFLFLRRHLKLTIIISIFALIVQILKWIFPNYLDFFKIIEKIFH